jgi:hypothetical protein
MYEIKHEFIFNEKIKLINHQNFSERIIKGGLGVSLRHIGSIAGE